MFQSLRALLRVIIEEDTDIGVGLDDVDQTLGIHVLDLVAHREVVVVFEELKVMMMMMMMIIMLMMIMMMMIMMTMSPHL